jgi:hypothetical protein
MRAWRESLVVVNLAPFSHSDCSMPSVFQHEEHHVSILGDNHVILSDLCLPRGVMFYHTEVPNDISLEQTDGRELATAP